MFLLLLAVAVSAAADDGKLAPELRNRTTGNPVNVIVQFNVLPTDRERSEIRRFGGSVRASLQVVQGLKVSLPANRLAALSGESDVVYISPDRKLHGFLTNIAPAVNAPYAWSQSLEGSGISVAVIDSGIGLNTTHTSAQSDFSFGESTTSRVVYSRSWVNDGAGTQDAYGHGTHVAGILAGNGFNSIGAQYTKTFKGVAPSVQLVNLRVLDGQGAGTDSAVISAIQTAIQLRTRYDIRVINLSLGRPVYESYRFDPLCRAVEAAYRAGIVVVVAAGNEGRDNSAGNDGYATISSPGNDPYVITVGAMKSMGTPTRTDDLIASYSSKGPTVIDHIVKPDLVAPGNKVISALAAPGTTLPTQYPQNLVPLSEYTSSSGTSSDYFTLSGTSMATPVVSGAVALLLQAQPNLTPDQVKARLMKTAYKTFPSYSSYTDPVTGITYTSQYDVFTVGAGYLDIQAALLSSDQSSGAAKSPAVQYDPNTQTVYFVKDSTAVWGGSASWSASAVWGGSAFVGDQSAVWGGSSPSSSSAVWGGSAVWGEVQAPVSARFGAEARFGAVALTQLNLLPLR